MSPSPPPPTYTDQELWKWTLTKDAIAPCFVRDALAMRPNPVKGSSAQRPDTDFFWLGYTPCRTVHITGLVVGVQVYERRTVYSVDDSTAVIDCVFRHPLPPRTGAAAKPRSHAGSSGSPQKKARLDPPPARAPTSTAAAPPRPPSPVTEVGYAVKVVGKVVKHYETRQIIVDVIEPCEYASDEISHWQRVIELHKSTYSIAKPFVMPKPAPAPPFPAPTSALPSTADAAVPRAIATATPSQAAMPPPPAPHTPTRQRTHTRTRRPSPAPSSASESAASSAPSSPAKPGNSTPKPATAPKLRHPSRLHTRDLTANTFRMYVKHYMDNAPPEDEDDAFEGGIGSLRTPTKSPRVDALQTPKPRATLNSRLDSNHERTPRTASTSASASTTRNTRGYTLSHLRRVPELALLAARVVRAEAKRRAREEARAHASQSQDANGGASARVPHGSSTRTTHGSSARTTPPSGKTQTQSQKHKQQEQADPPRLKMKRLFAWAVVRLYEEGAIVLWDGPVRRMPCPPALFAPRGGGGSQIQGQSQRGNGDGETSALWKTANSTLFSTTTGGGSTFDDEDADAELSDPREGEEAYVPLTPAFLAGYVREAVGRMGTGTGRGRGRGRPSAEDVTACLRRMDARWARVGAWTVEEAMGIAGL
ncbi:hypothetical protein BV22DRAFT_1038277 [Leucogyrophana mollusca]|uniref:Uncharacterized protein n=1 Tax=Leucogyrophana mollusca TaxID=85980 RepID=A0ACB8BAD3_9AGAM|nr:hypothetical protein BV22DRAFT_1038277 [Leucogyrophana mollusca]